MSDLTMDYNMEKIEIFREFLWLLEFMSIKLEEITENERMGLRDSKFQ